MVSQYENGPDFQTPNEARIAELENEVEELKRDRNGWRGIVGTIAAQVPLPHVLSATGTTGDLIAYLKDLHARASVAEGEAQPVAIDVEKFKAKYREFWPSAWPDNALMAKEFDEVLRASITAALSSVPGKGSSDV